MFEVRWYLSVDGKDGADGYEAVDVGGAVERIKTHNIFALEVKKILGFRYRTNKTRFPDGIDLKNCSNWMKLLLTHKSNKLFNKVQAFGLQPRLQ